MTGAVERSRLRLVDTVAESWIYVGRRPGRTVVSSLGVALGTAAIVATLSLVSTIRFQVSDTFDALLATQVDLSTSGNAGPSDQTPPFPPTIDQLDQLSGLSGVEGVAVVRQTRLDQRVASNRVDDPTRTPTLAPVHFLNPDGLAVLDATVAGVGWNAWHEQHAARVAVISRATAQELGMSDATPGDHVFVNGLAFTVLGIVEDSPRLPALRTGVIVPAALAPLFEIDLDRDRLVTVVAPGAAPGVAAASPLALTPDAPATWTAYAPSSDDSLRQSVDSQLETLAVGLGAVVLVLGIFSIGNVTLSSVLQRIHEIGLRRSLGARPRHIAAHVLLDAAVVGAIGGALGAFLGLCATLGVTATQGWLPVIDPRVPAVTVGIGFLAGILAGIYPARVASRLQPTEALRRE